MPKRGKKYQEAAKLVDPTTDYSPEEAVTLVKKTAYTTFDATIEAVQKAMARQRETKAAS